MAEVSSILFSPISLSSLEEMIDKVVNNALAKQVTFSPLQKTGAVTQNQFLTRKEAAKLLGVSLVTLDEWSKTGVIAAYRISSRVRFKRDELEDSLQLMDTSNFKKK